MERVTYLQHSTSAEWSGRSTRAELCEQKTNRILTGYTDRRGHGQLVRLHLLGTDFAGAAAVGLNSLILRAGREPGILAGVDPKPRLMTWIYRGLRWLGSRQLQRLSERSGGNHKTGSQGLAQPANP